MATDPLFGVTDAGESDIRAALTRIRRQNRQEMRVRYDLAVDYLEGRQAQDTKRQLLERFPASQSADKGQEIYPITVPLTDRYVSEAATAYNRTVTRTLVDANGEESDATRTQTKAYNDALELAHFDERMHRAEQIQVLLDVQPVWFQAKRGELRPTLVLPQDIYEVASDIPGADPLDPEDYTGFVVELRSGETDVVRAAQARRFAFVEPAQVTYYEGSEPWEPARILSSHPNPFAWEHAEDTASGKPSTVVRPGQMVTFWHRRFPLDALVSGCDSDIVQANRELNVVWSVLFDELRIQGFAVPVKKLADKSSAQAIQKHGARFPVVLNLEESFEYISAAVNYTQQVDVLQSFVRLLAVAKRMSPNDFSLQGASALSGFAKLVDSLPKLEAREERVKRLKAMEEQEAWPRCRAILQRFGVLDASTLQMKLRVKFADIEFPQTPAEEAMKLETDVSYNLTTPAKVLAKRLGLSVEEAQKVVDENAAANAKERPTPPGGVVPLPRLGGRIGRTTSSPMGQGPDRMTGNADRAP